MKLKDSCLHLLLGACLVLAYTSCAKKPAKVEILPENVVLEGAGSTQKLEAKVYDGEGTVITEGIEVVWFSDDTSLIKLDQNGEVIALSSGEAKVEVEVVGTDLKTETAVRVKIPQSINVSHEKLRLWTGQVKDNVWAEVHSEKDAFIEGYLPSWSSDDSTIVKVEPIQDPNRRQSWVRLTGLKSGTTYINAQFKNISKNIRVAVFDEDEEVLPDGTRIPKVKEEEVDEEKDKSNKEAGAKTKKQKSKK